MLAFYLALSRIFCLPKSLPKSRRRRSSHDPAAGPQIVPREPASLPALRAAVQGVAEALESVLSDNTRRVYQTQWRILEPVYDL